MRLSQQEIRQAASAIEEVDGIDRTIKSILDIVSDVYEDYGKSVRDIFGRTRLSQFRNDYLGSVVICAVINALLEERSRIVSANEITEFPDAPCFIPRIIRKPT